MKELMKHLPAIKNFMQERTQTLQELSDSMIKKFLTEAYKLPFLFPVRIIVSEERFVNFLFDMRKELFEGKKINTTIQEESKEDKKIIDTLPASLEKEEEKVEATNAALARDKAKAKTKTTTKTLKKPTEGKPKKTVKASTNSSENQTNQDNKKEKVLA